jgi:hypothetical protein
MQQKHGISRQDNQSCKEKQAADTKKNDSLMNTILLTGAGKPAATYSMSVER